MALTMKRGLRLGRNVTQRRDYGTTEYRAYLILDNELWLRESFVSFSCFDVRRRAEVPVIVTRFLPARFQPVYLSALVVDLEQLNLAVRWSVSEKALYDGSHPARTYKIRVEPAGILPADLWRIPLVTYNDNRLIQRFMDSYCSSHMSTYLSP
jgi:hypothetical protein